MAPAGLSDNREFGLRVEVYNPHPSFPTGDEAHIHSEGRRPAVLCPVIG